VWPHLLGYRSPVRLASGTVAIDIDRAVAALDEALG